MNYKKIDAELDYHFEALYSCALGHLKKICQCVIKENKNLSSFQMGMGTWYFSKDDGTIQHDNESINGDSIKVLIMFFNDWDFLKLTGEPIFIDSKQMIKEY